MARLEPLSPQLLAFASRSGIKPKGEPSVQIREVPVNGITLSYVDWGGPAERPVLFAHGGGLTARTWDVVCLALRDRYRCVALDLRGHGDSSWSDERDYAFETFAEDVAQFAEHEGFARGVFVGNSLGGQLSLLGAGGRLEPRGLVLVDVGPEPNMNGTQRIIEAIDRPQEYASIEDVVDRALALNPRREREVLRESLRNNLRQLSGGTWTWKYDPKVFSGMTVEVRRAHGSLLWDAVARVTCPVLAVRGADSDIFTAAQAEELCSRLPDCAWTEVPDAGHTVQGDNPAGLVAALEPFLARCFQSSPASERENATASRGSYER